jgi:hypothetical protein
MAIGNHSWFCGWGCNILVNQGAGWIWNFLTEILIFYRFWLLFRNHLCKFNLWLSFEKVRHECLMVIGKSRSFVANCGMILDGCIWGNDELGSVADEYWAITGNCRRGLHEPEGVIKKNGELISECRVAGRFFQIVIMSPVYIRWRFIQLKILDDLKYIIWDDLKTVHLFCKNLAYILNRCRWFWTLPLFWQFIRSDLTTWKLFKFYIYRNYMKYNEL